MAGIQIDGVNNKIDLDDDKDTSISANVDDTLLVEVGGANVASITSGEFAINDDSADIDFRVESDNNTHAFFVQGSNGVVGFGTSTLNTNFNVAGGAEFTTTGNVNNFRIISTDAGSATAPDIVFVKDSASPADGDFLGRVDFRGDDSAGNETNFISLFARANVVTNGSEQGALTFTDGDGGNSLLHIQNTAVIFNQDSIDTDFRVESNGNTHMLFIDGGEDHVGINTSSNYHASLSTVASGERALFVYQNANQDTTAMQIRNAFAQSSNTASMIVFQDSGGTERGSIKTSGSATQFNTSSDYRLKENVDYDWDATTRLKQLKPARFNWIADDTNTLLDGFIAHEVSSVVPEAVAGEKDGMENYIDEDTGEEKTRIKPQGIDHSKLVPLMVKTIQELEARIKTLEGA